MWVVVAAVSMVLRFTVPAYEPDRAFSNCDSITTALHIPERPLTVRTRFWYLDGGGMDMVVDQHPVTPGTIDSTTVPWDHLRPATACSTLLDPSGNESCRTCVALGVWPVGVTPPAARVDGARPASWFDVGGRRLTGPPGNGVALYAHGDTLAKVSFRDGRAIGRRVFIR